MRITGLLSWAIATAVLLPAVVAAQRAIYAPTAAADARPLGLAQRQERRFLQVSAESLRFQAEAARLVLKRSTSPDVNEVAAAMLARQQALQPELQRLLHARGMAMPLPDNDHGKALKQLARLNGARLDRVYVEEVVLRSGHADMANFEKMALQAEDPVLKAWLERQLPVLREHVARAGKALPSAALRTQREV
jgi:predicted outer membrane protein